MSNLNKKNKISDGLSSHSKTIVLDYPSYLKKENIPFCGYHFNRKKVTASTSADSCTHQEFADDVDINYIIKRHMNEGIPFDSSLFDKAIFDAQYPTGDFSALVEKIDAAKSIFQDMPSGLRNYFQNDVTKFATFVGNSSDDKIKEVFGTFGFKFEELEPAAGSQDVLTSALDKNVSEQQKVSSENVSAP